MDDNAPSVLVYSKDPLLLEARAKVIQTGGLRTSEANSARELVERLNYAVCTVLVLCHTLPKDEAIRASRVARLMVPSIKIVAIGHRSAAFDEIVGGVVAPNELLTALSHTVLN